MLLDLAAHQVVHSYAFVLSVVENTTNAYTELEIAFHLMINCTYDRFAI